MAVQVSHRIYPEIPETAAIRGSEETSRGSVSSIGKAERMLDRRGAHHAGSRTHVDQCAAKIGGIERGGVHQGQEPATSARISPSMGRSAYENRFPFNPIPEVEAVNTR